MKILLDVNIVVDILGKTNDFLKSFEALDILILRGFEPCLLVSEVTVINYVLSARKLASKNEALQTTKDFCELCSLLDATSSDLKHTFEKPGIDFEDSVIAWTAKRHEIDLILTRDKRGFREGPVAFMMPDEFSNLYRPNGYTCQLIDF